MSTFGWQTIQTLLRGVVHLQKSIITNQEKEIAYISDDLLDFINLHKLNDLNLEQSTQNVHCEKNAFVRKKQRFFSNSKQNFSFWFDLVCCCFFLLFCQLYNTANSTITFGGMMFLSTIACWNSVMLYFMHTVKFKLLSSLILKHLAKL